MAQIDSSGSTNYFTNSFTELATGMHHLVNNQWVESTEGIQITPEGGIATNAIHKVAWAANINTAWAIRLLTPDGKDLRSHVLGLSYFDTSTGSSVFIATMKDSIGQVQPSGNQVIYGDAFTEVNADVRYTLTRAGFEQDIILREQLPSPAEWGMNPETTRLQVFTEFLNPPSPHIKQVQPWPLVDQILDFGAMEMGQGKAFSLEDGSALIPVRKQWVTLQGRHVLIEEVDIQSIAAQLETLPPAPAPPSTGTNAPHGAMLHRAYPNPLLPEPKLARKSDGGLRIAASRPKDKGLVLDYTIMTSQTNFTFKGSTTYYVSGAVNLSATTTVEGGTVVKYTNTTSATITFTGPLACLSGPYYPAVFTSKDDNSVGDILPGSTGNPTNNYYANIALNLNAGTNILTLQNLRICNAKTAIALGSGAGDVFSHVQLVNCQNGISATNADFSLRNALFSNVLTNFTGSSSTGRVEHLTVDTAAWLNNNIGTNLFLTNCLLVSVTNLGSYSATSSYANNSGGLFQTVGAGAHYLADGSPYRDAGTTNINAALALSLNRMTTWPPLLLTNNFTNNTTLSPQAQRDSGNGSFDVGYHYDPLDYLCSQVDVQSSLTLTNGVAVGWYGHYGFSMSGANAVYGGGAPGAMNLLACYPSVQEQPLNNINANDGTFNLSGAGSTSPGAAKPVIQLRFTDLPMLGGRQNFFGPVITAINLGGVTLQDCSLRGVFFRVALGQGFTTWPTPFPAVHLWNNALQRCTVALAQGYPFPGPPYYNNPLAAQIYNNLFWNSSLVMDYQDSQAAYHPSWNVFDNLFDGAAISEVGDGAYGALITGTHNAGYNTPSLSQLSGTPNYTLTSLSYASGALGPWYIGASSPTLVNAGVMSAPSAGLYHYTIQTSQVKEGNTTVDIGYHYVAVNTNGIAINLPIDTDGDGVPDYLEDANGNGAVDSGETDWQDKRDLGLKVLITRPKNSIP